ncbi:hypothetical protein JD844_002630 [Phrynosoma platyrhinos]|uniref:Mammalian ependymin-related protein 1 n=1 Tax=Phrynosoma platyrhinos TaxID=52577 RepID=A0ABQ7TCE5_PHRPL|nr:hypothetical protein JD844_002630 [Phrynosoma platyrhinos]
MAAAARLLLCGALFFSLSPLWSPCYGRRAPSPCQAPEQWEGRTVVYDHGTGRNTRALLAYDGPNQRLRLLEERKALIPCKKSINGMMMMIHQWDDDDDDDDPSVG